MADSRPAFGLGKAMAGNHAGGGNAVRYESPVKRMVARPSGGHGNRKGACALVELQPGTVDHSGPANQHKGWLGRHEEG